jgi:hypothetical protein
MLLRLRPEIEEAIRVRAFAVASPSGAEAPGYLEGLRGAIVAAVDSALRAIGEGVERSEAVPPQIRAQARNAARSGVGLDIVLRRYAAGYSVLGDFLRQAVRQTGHGDEETESRLQRDLAALFDHLVEVVGDEYRDEAGKATRGDSGRDSAAISRLLAGELVDTSRIDYEFRGWHLGLLAWGAKTKPLLRALASTLDRRLLIAEAREGAISAWLGGRDEFSDDQLLQLAEVALSESDARLAVGEPGKDQAGWRMTHLQARKAYEVALHDRSPFVRYRDVALIATVLHDDLLRGFLTESYLRPLSIERGGARGLETLKAYFGSGRSVSSTAAALGVTRQTVTNRLRVIEERIGGSLESRGAELEAALRLSDLDA